MPRFKAGDLVRIIDLGKPGHVRIPWYVREREGIVERYCGTYPNPEELAYAKPGLPPIDLYRVRLAQSDIWADYNGPQRDTLEIEVYDHWLAPAARGKPTPEVATGATAKQKRKSKSKARGKSAAKGE